MAFLECCLRVLSGVLQVIFALCAIGLMIYGSLSAFMIFISNSSEVLKSELTIIPSALSAILGLVLLIFVVLGCWGVCRQSICCMQTYSGFLLVLAIAHVALGAYCLMSYGKDTQQFAIRFKIEEEFEKMVEYYSISSQTKDKVDMTQEWFECCAAKKDPLIEYRNFRNEDSSRYYGAGRPPPNEVPNTCCERSDPCTTNSPDFYNQLCGTKISESTIVINLIVGWSSLAMGAIEFFAALFGVCLSCCIWTKNTGSWR